MNIQFKVNKDLIVTFDAEREVEAVETLASLQETFGVKACPLPGAQNDLKWHVRMVDDDKYYEMHCTVIVDGKRRQAKLAFGQNKKGGTLYPKVNMDKSSGKAPYWRPWSSKTGKDENKWYDAKGQGWHIYDKDESKDPETK